MTPEGRTPAEKVKPLMDALVDAAARARSTDPAPEGRHDVAEALAPVPEEEPSSHE